MAWHQTWNDSPPPPRQGFFVDRGGAFPPGVTLVLVATVAVYALDALTHGLMSALGALSVQTLLSLEIWRLVTYMFLHANFMHIFINMFVFWMLGAVLERQVGTRQFLGLYFASGIFGGLLEATFNLLMAMRFGGEAGEVFLLMPAVGASAGVMGILIAFAVLNPRAKFLIFFLLPVEAWLFAVLYAAYETWPIVRDLFLSSRPQFADSVAHAAHFGGMVVGFVWMKWGHHLGRLLGRDTPRQAEPFVERPPDEEEAELDCVLDKIHREGLDSLSLRERMFLQEISRKRRRGDGDE
jgi:membrane associated rhomboid family serine protease